MAENNYTGIIPDQQHGKIIDVESEKEFSDEASAKSFYQAARKRLININNWHEIAGALTANFQLVDADGKEVNREVKSGDYFKINIPGPGSPSGDGYDWAHVDVVKEVSDHDIESTGIRVHPASSPQNSDPAIAHFYDPESTSSFIVSRIGRVVRAGVYDRNIEANTDGGDLVDKARNTVVGTGAAHLFSSLQWQALVDALTDTGEK